MIDIEMLIYNALISDETILSSCEDRIKFYSYSETGEKNKPFIVICPTRPSVPTSFGSNKKHSETYYFQIIVECSTREERNNLAIQIRQVMESIGFGQQAGGLTTYFEETGRFVDSRNYNALYFD